MLKHAFRTGVRNCYTVPRHIFRFSSATPVIESQSITLVNTSTNEDPGLTRESESPATIVKRDGESFQSSGVLLSAHNSNTTPNHPKERLSGVSSKSDFGHWLSRSSNATYNRTNQTIFVDVDSLTPYEWTHAQNEVDDRSVWVSSHELSDSLPTVSHEVIKNENALLHPLSSKELVYRLHEATTFRPLPSLSRIIGYHNSYPNLQSATSYNFLIQLCIRHTVYSVAFRLLRNMKSLGIAPNRYTSLLHIRLLVRAGWYDEAWSLTRTELVSRDSHHGIAAFLEMLGQRYSFEFSSNAQKNDITSQNSITNEHSRNSALPDRRGTSPSLQSGLISCLLEILPQEFVPSDQFILVVVRFLLRNSQKKVAQDMTMLWLSQLPRQLNSVRQRHCQKVVHLHLGLSGKGAKSHFANRKFVDKVIKLCPSFKPNSSTLYLLLGSLQWTMVKPTFNALQLVDAYKKKWGPDIIDKRVRRRIVAIATREGLTRVAQKWVEIEKEAEKFEDVSYTRHVLGQGSIAHPGSCRRIPFRKMMPGIDAEKRKWRRALRRLQRRRRPETRSPS